MVVKYAPVHGSQPIGVCVAEQVRMQGVAAGERSLKQQQTQQEAIMHDVAARKTIKMHACIGYRNTNKYMQHTQHSKPKCM